MKYILFISLLFISCSKNSESNSINEDENLTSETERVSNEYYEIYLLEQLNENRGYCIYIKGSKLNADPDNGLQAHTCYSYQGEVSVDQGFDNVKIDRLCLLSVTLILFIYQKSHINWSHVTMIK